MDPEIEPDRDEHIDRPAGETARLEAPTAGRFDGLPAMMIWGTMFVAEANGNSGAAEVRVRDLVAFIASIQESR
jgi:hypothetical protein